MEIGLVQRLASELRVSPEQIVREYWEITLLNELSTEAWSTALGFKGGTALRLAYGSPRFSDDLDFSLLGRIPYSRFLSWAKKVAEKYPLELTDAAAKRKTYLVEFRIRDAAISRSFKQKLEVSLRNNRSPRRKANGYELRLLTSPITNIQVLFRVATAELIWQEKMAALKNRREARDLFDLWYLSQQLRRPLPEGLPRLSPTVVKRDLNRYLPPAYRSVVEQLAKR